MLNKSKANKFTATKIAFFLLLCAVHFRPKPEKKKKTNRTMLSSTRMYDGLLSSQQNDFGQCSAFFYFTFFFVPVWLFSNLKCVETRYKLHNNIHRLNGCDIWSSRSIWSAVGLPISVRTMLLWWWGHSSCTGRSSKFIANNLVRMSDGRLHRQRSTNDLQPKAMKHE